MGWKHKKKKEKHLLFVLEDTPLKINMEPKNGDFEDGFPFQRGDFQVPC